MGFFLKKEAKTFCPYSLCGHRGTTRLTRLGFQSSNRHPFVGQPTLALTKCAALLTTFWHQRSV
jgi:hypothetical protein